MSSNPPRNHHYIPAFYLKRWAGSDGLVCQYKRVHGGQVATYRKHPDATGYKRDLYRLDGAPPEIAQAFETTFMRMVDTYANDALQQIVSGDQTPWGPRERSAWTRFLLSLRFRNPEAVELLKHHMLDIFEASTEDLRAQYSQRRQPNHPLSSTSIRNRPVQDLSPIEPR